MGLALRCAQAFLRVRDIEVALAMKAGFPHRVDIATGSVCGRRSMHSSLGSCRKPAESGPENLLAALAYSGKGTIKIGRLGRYPRCQRRLKSPLRRLPVHEAGAFRAPKTGQALSRFEPLRMKSFHAAEKNSPAGRSRSKRASGAYWNT